MVAVGAISGGARIIIIGLGHDHRPQKVRHCGDRRESVLVCAPACATSVERRSLHPDETRSHTLIKLYVHGNVAVRATMFEPPVHEVPAVLVARNELARKIRIKTISSV